MTRSQNTRFVRVTGYDPSDERRRESLFSLGNGLLVLRSAMPWSRADDHHYPGMYYAGCYNPLPSRIEGETVWDESIVNLPNGLAVNFRFDDGAWFALEATDVLHYEQALDMQAGIMRRTARVKDGSGRITDIDEERFVSMQAPNLVGLRLSLTPRNWTGSIAFESLIDGSVANAGLERHADYAGRHLRVSAKGAEDDDLFLTARTINSHLDVAVRTRTVLSRRAELRDGEKADECVSLIHSVQVEPDRPITLEKVMAVFVGPGDGPDVQGLARAALARAADYEVLQEQHRSAWMKLWDKMPFSAEDQGIEQAQNFALFHLVQTYSCHSVGRDVGLPARGWQEAYRGHVFWDEMFCLPVISIRFPELAREMLKYRHARLGAAKANARKYGLQGALYPWRSARTGEEETPRFQKSPITGNWREDHTAHQVHINASIAWDIFHYLWATGDRDFLDREGLEMLVEICRMWASLAVHDPRDDRFDIVGVVGPDEFHTQYRTRERLGIDNNAYTNAMAAWTLAQVLDALQASSSAVLDKFGLTRAETDHWDHVSRRLRLHVSPGGLISQFKNVEALEPLDPDSLGKGSADWILEARGKDINDYQLFKQADFAVLAYLFSVRELITLFDRLGYSISTDQLYKSLDYYLARTSHGSSLSQVTYAAGLAAFDEQRSWSTWHQALAPDLNPDYAQTTAEGLHIGAMAASLDVLQRHYLGLCVRADGLHLQPMLPDKLAPVRFAFRYCDGQYEISWDGQAVRLRSSISNTGGIEVHSSGRSESLAPGEEIEVILAARP